MDLDSMASSMLSTASIPSENVGSAPINPTRESLLLLESCAPSSTMLMLPSLLTVPASKTNGNHTATEGWRAGMSAGDSRPHRPVAKATT